MAEEVVKLRSSIRPSLMRSTLFRGSILGGMGVLLIAYAGAFLPLMQLNTYGLPLFAVGCAFVTRGLLPYRRLCLLEKTPHELWMTEDHLIYRMKRKQVFSIGLSSIQKVSYIDTPKKYGISIILKDPLPEKVIVFDKSFINGCLLNDSAPKIFLPYFSKRSYGMLEEFLAPPI